MGTSKNIWIWGNIGAIPYFLKFGDIVPMKGTTDLDLARVMRATPETSLTGSGIMDKAKEKGVNKLTKSGVAGSAYHVDFKPGWKLLTDPDNWKIPTKQEVAGMKQRIAALKRSYEAVKNLGFKGPYASFAKKIGAVHKPAFYFQDLEVE